MQATRTSIIRPLYISEVERKFQREERASSGLYNAGDIGKCIRAAYYNRAVKHGLLPYIAPDLPLQWKFNQGLIVEGILGDALRAEYPNLESQIRFTNEAHQIAGVIDYKIDTLAIECKAQMSKAWDYAKKDATPFKSIHIAQLAYYKHFSGLEIDEARLFVSAYDAFPMIDEFIAEDDEVWQLFPDGSTRWFKNRWTKDRLAYQAERMVACWERKELPPIELADDEKWQCKYCPHAQICANNINPLINKEN